MNKPVLLVQNIPHEGAGLLEEILRHHDIASRRLDLDDRCDWAEATWPGSIIVFGGPKSANDETPAMKKELAAVARVLDEEKPFMGICLGMQVLVKAAGGRVFRHTHKEVG